MENKIITIPVSDEGHDGICLKIDEKVLRDAGFKPGEIMSLRIKDGRIEIERGREMPGIEQLAEDHIRQMSYYDTGYGYKGYEVSLKLERHNQYQPRYILSADDAYNFLKPLEYEPREHVLSMMLDTSHKVVGVYEAAIGTIDRAILEPYQVFQAAYLTNANKILLAHNHPSGNITPSQQDYDLTARIKEAAEIMNIKLLDHIIVGDGKYTSFSEKGYL